MNQIRTCPVCMHHCRLAPGQLGRCRARKNEQGRIVSVNYGKVTALALDPIEKKPLRQFYPGSKILSVHSFGCNLSCPFCQNHEISMHGEQAADHVEMTPLQLADLAEEMQKRGNIGVAYTYNEPLIGHEFVRDCAAIVHARGMKNVVVTNGNVQLEILEALLPTSMR
ncbi:MAG: radical SAM protein [Merdibacter sp.]